VRQIQRGVDLVQNVERRGLEEQQGQDQRQRNKGPLSAAELSETLLPHVAKGNLAREGNKGT
jgi:hypothetical protein